MKAIELFAGAGGLGIGISRAGFKPVKIVEWDRWCCDTINRNRWRRVRPVAGWPEPEHGDVREADFTPFEDQVTLVSGGPPCQPFSLGGKHQAHADSRDMWPQAVRAVRETKPKAFVFENVKGLTRAAFRPYFEYITLQLKHPEVVRREEEDWTAHRCRLIQHDQARGRSGLTYKVKSQILNAANYGVPQKRERVIFVGFRSDLELAWDIPVETHSLDALAWDQCRSNAYWDRHEVPRMQRQVDHRIRARALRLLDQPATAPWCTVRDAISDLPEPAEAYSTQVLNHRLQPGARAYAGHTGSPLDEPAKTLKAGVHGVPGGENMLVRSDGTVRYFSVRESARLQTFPDDYELHGSWTEAMRQLGNAVAVDLATVIAKNLVEQLNNVWERDDRFVRGNAAPRISII
jgi:DNA (cytosine-5)-methyltransferase 1